MMSAWLQKKMVLARSGDTKFRFHLSRHHGACKDIAAARPADGEYWSPPFPCCMSCLEIRCHILCRTVASIPQSQWWQLASSTGGSRPGPAALPPPANAFASRRTASPAVLCTSCPKVKIAAYLVRVTASTALQLQSDQPAATVCSALGCSRAMNQSDAGNLLLSSSTDRRVMAVTETPPASNLLPDLLQAGCF